MKAPPVPVAWLGSAWRQYQDALEWVSQERPQAALTQDEAITEAVARLGEYPQVGRPGRKQGTRELVVPGTPFIVVYRIKEQDIGQVVVQVISFLHGAQRWP